MLGVEPNGRRPERVAREVKQGRAVDRIAARLEIQVLVVPGIGGDADRVLGQRRRDRRLRRGRRRELRGDERIAPGIGRVVRVLHRRRVVDAEADAHRGVAEVESFGERPHVHDVDEDRPAHIVVSALDEAARPVRGAAGEIEAHLIECGVVVVAEVRGGRRRLRRSGMGERCDCGGGQRDVRQQSLASGLRVAADLEGSAIRGELRAERADMTGGTWLAGLRSERRHRTCRFRGSNRQDQNDEDRCDSSAQIAGGGGHTIFPETPLQLGKTSAAHGYSFHHADDALIALLTNPCA
jgi:hypothetical protein